MTTSLITKAWNAVVRFVQPDVDAIILTFLKAQRKLESFIERETAFLAAETAAVDALMKRKLERNRAIDRAYRVTHNLSQLTA